MTSKSGSPNDNEINPNENDSPTCESSNDGTILQQKITDLEDTIDYLQDENYNLKYRIQRMKLKMKTMKEQSFIFSNINVTDKKSKVKCNKLMEEVHFITDLREQIDKLSVNIDDRAKNKRDKKNYLRKNKNGKENEDEDEPNDLENENENNLNSEEKINDYNLSPNRPKKDDIINNETINNIINKDKQNFENENSQNIDNTINDITNFKKDNAATDNKADNTNKNVDLPFISQNSQSFENWIHNYYEKVEKFKIELDRKIQELLMQNDDKYKQFQKSNNLNQKLNRILSNFQRLTNDLNKSKEENELLKSKIEAIKSENQQMKSENGKIKSENEKMKSDKQQIQSEIESIKAENQKIKSEAENTKTENQRLRSFNQKLRANNQNIKSQFETIKAENQTVKTDSQQLNDENQKLRDEIQALKSENFILKSDNQKIISENQSLKAENQTLTAENQMTKDQLKLQAQNDKKQPKLQRDKLVESQKNMITQLQSQLQLSEKNLKAKSKQEKDAISKLNTKMKSLDNLMDKTFGKSNAQRLIKTNSRQIMNKMNDLGDKIHKLQYKIQQLQQFQQQQATKAQDFAEIPKSPASIDKSWKEILDFIKPISPSQGQIPNELFNAYLDRINKAISNQDLSDPIVSSTPSTTKAIDRITNAIQILINNNPNHAQKSDQKMNEIICKLLSAPVEGNLRTPIVWKNTVNIITASESCVPYEQWKPSVDEAFFVDSLQNLTEKNIGKTMVEQLLIVTTNDAIASNPKKFNYWINIISSFILPLFWENYECIDIKCQNSIIIPMLSFYNQNMSVPNSISTLSGIHKNPKIAYYTMQVLIRAESLLPIGNQIEFNELHTDLLTFLILTFPVKITINQSANYIYPDTPRDLSFKESVQFLLTKQCRRTSNQYPSFTSSIRSSNLDSGNVSINISDSESGTGSVSLSNSIIANQVADNGNSYVQLLLTFYDSELTKQATTIVMQLSKSTNIFPQIFLILSTLFYRLTEALMANLVKKATNEMTVTHSKRKPPVNQQPQENQIQLPSAPQSPASEIDPTEASSMTRSISNSSIASMTSTTSQASPKPKTNLILSLSLKPEVVQAYSDLFNLLLHLRPFLSACQRNIPSERLGPTLLNPILTCQNQFCTFQLVCIFFTIYFDSSHYSKDTIRTYCDKLQSMSQLFSVNKEMKNMFNLYASIFASICSNQLLEMNKIPGSSTNKLKKLPDVPIASSSILPSDEQFLLNPVLYAMSSLKIKCTRVPYLFFAFSLHFTNEESKISPSSSTLSPEQDSQRMRNAANRRKSTPLAKTNPDAVAAAQVAAALSKQPDGKRASAIKQPTASQATRLSPTPSPNNSPSSTKTPEMAAIPKLSTNTSEFPKFSPSTSPTALTSQNSPGSPIEIPKLSLNSSSDFPSSPEFGSETERTPEHFSISPEFKPQILSGRNRRLSTVDSNNFNITMNSTTAHNFATSYMKGIGKYNNYSHTVKFIETIFSIYLAAKKKNSRCYSSYIYKTICPLLFDIFLHKTGDEIDKENSYSKPLLTILNRLIEDLIFRQNVDSKVGISWLKFYIDAINATSKEIANNELDPDIENIINNNKELALEALSVCMNCCCSPFIFRYSVIPIVNSRIMMDYTSMFSPSALHSNFSSANSYISNVLRYTASTIVISKQILEMNSTTSALTNSSSFPSSFQIFNNFITDSQFKLTPFFFTTFYFVFQCEIANDNVKEFSPELVTNFKRLVSNISSISDSECLLNLLTIIPYHYDEINPKSPELVPYIFDKLSSFAKTDKCSNEQFTFIIQFATDLICNIDPNDPLFEKVIAFMLFRFNDNTFKNKLRDEYFSFFFENFMNNRKLMSHSIDFFNKSTTGANQCTIVDKKSEIITFNLFSCYMTISNCYETNNYKLEIVKKDNKKTKAKTKANKNKNNNSNTVKIKPMKVDLKGQTIECLIAPKTKMDPALMTDVFLSLKKNKQWLLCTPQGLELVESFSDRCYTEKHVIPIVFIARRQRTLEEILGNRIEQTSESFIDFLSCLGENVKVEDTSFISSISRIITLIDDPSQSQQQIQLQQQLTTPITVQQSQQEQSPSKNQLKTNSPTTVSSPNLPSLNLKQATPVLQQMKHLSPRQRISPRRLSSGKKDQEKQQEKAANIHIANRLEQILNLLDGAESSIYFRNCRHEVLFVPYPFVRKDSQASENSETNDFQSNSKSSFVSATISIAWFESPHDKLPKKTLSSMFVIALRPLEGDMFLVNVRCNIPQPNKNAPNAVNMNEYMKITSIPFCSKNPFMVPASALGLVIRDLVIIIENHINFVSRSISTSTQSQALAQLKANGQSNYLVTSDITPSNCFYYSSKLAYENAWSVIRKREPMF